jgi:hypothetical protein
MSVKAMTWVFDHSPYTLGTRLVHLAIADVANDEHGGQVWAAHATLARKAKVSLRTVGEAVGTMVREGYLDVVRAEPGKPTTYRFLMPTPAKSAGVGEGGAVNSTSPPQRSGTTPTTNASEHKAAQDRLHVADVASDVPIAERARLLRQAMAAHHVGGDT